MVRRLTLVLCFTALAQPAFAQSFLGGLARQAAERAAAAAANRVMDGGRQGAGAAPAVKASPIAAPSAAGPDAGSAAAAPAPAGEPSSPAARPAPVVASGPAPWPINAGHRDVKRPGQLEFSAETKALETAFDDFGMVKCTGCEGGRSYDSWAQHSIKLESGYNAWDKRLGALALGETLTWKGAESTGRITVVSETPVGGFRCKQLKWELFKKDARAERPGLVCWGYSSPYSGSESWVEVF